MWKGCRYVDSRDGLHLAISYTIPEGKFSVETSTRKQHLADMTPADGHDSTASIFQHHFFAVLAAQYPQKKGTLWRLHRATRMHEGDGSLTHWIVEYSIGHVGLDPTVVLSIFLSWVVCNGLCFSWMENWRSSQSTWHIVLWRLHCN